MLPRLQAEETLEAVTAAALGSGAMKPQEARRLTAALTRRARGHAGPRTADPRVLAAMGIACVREDAPAPGDGNGSAGSGPVREGT